MKSILNTLFILFTVSTVSLAQMSVDEAFKSSVLKAPIPINRQLFHENIDKLQVQADKNDGKTDNKIQYKDNADLSKLLTENLFKRVDKFQIALENLPVDHFTKIKYIRWLEDDLKAYNREATSLQFEPLTTKDLFDIYELVVKSDIAKKSFNDKINNPFTKAWYTSMFLFKDNKSAISEVYKGMIKMYPDRMINNLREIAGESATDDLIANAAIKNPKMILNFATSTSVEREIVRRNKDPLVSKIVDIANNTSAPLKGIVFLQEYIDGKMTTKDINEVIGNREKYYKKMVELRLKITPLNKKVIDQESKIEALEYVRKMNELHDSPDATRFKCIEGLTPPEMYYLMTLCSDEIYTSTFIGTYNRMMTKIKPMRGDEFLTSLNNDKFRTFIRMSAGYNKLDEFLATTDEEHKNTLMSSFVHNIDDNIETDLEDAVDVADAFGSITDPKLLDFLLNELKTDYERTYKDNKKRGLVIYFLLHTLCGSLVNPDDTSDQLQNVLKIPPITRVNYNSLLDDTSKSVVMEVFFYGDEDGISSMSNFKGNFTDATTWKKTENKNFLTYTSIKGKPVTIFANLPLPEPKDEEAQLAMTDYIGENEIKPTIVVHRGHSYHLSSTLDRITNDNKIIILGSCGGYHNLSTILEKSEDAHIISSKQTGTMFVNDAIIKLVNNSLLDGKDINWVDMWKQLDVNLKKDASVYDKFNDYVPPHKNMGALFLKAFRIQMAENKL
jgi:hypothetical protein